MAFTNADRMNEPDLGTQANLSPTDAAKLWKDHIQPFAGKSQTCLSCGYERSQDGEGRGYGRAMAA